MIATVNEDANSAYYTIRTDDTPPADAVTRYAYNEGLPHLGGTDAISVDEGQIFISASAPGTNGRAGAATELSRRLRGDPRPDHSGGDRPSALQR